jgi:hypothetical protein
MTIGSDSTLWVDSWSVGHFVCGSVFIVLLTSLLTLLVRKKETTNRSLIWLLALGLSVICHQFFEIYENTQQGHVFWNRAGVRTFFTSVGFGYVEYSGDSAINSAGDTLFFTLGAIVSIYVFHLHHL